MDTVLSAVLGSMHTDVARMDRVAMNIANAQTAGYKRELLVTGPFSTRVEAVAPAVYVDQRPATLKATGQPLDLALAGRGWFEIATPHGTAYTRQGNFRLDGAGRLVTQQGHAVMGIGGEIHLTSGAPAIDAGGHVFESASSRKSDAALAQIKVVEFEPGANLVRAGDGAVRVQGVAKLAVDADIQVKQGFLENSNVSHAQEMVRLLETMRHIETMQKVALGYDEMLASGIRKLGEST